MLLKPDSAVSLSEVNRQDVSVKVNLPHGLSYVAGEVIQGTIEIDNPQSIHIKRIECTIDRSFRVESEETNDRIVNITLPCINGSEAKHLEEIFDIQIPDDLPPTFKFVNHGGIRNIGVVVRVSYTITFEVCVVGLLADFSVKQPLTIAIDPWKHENDGTIILIDRTQAN